MGDGISMKTIVTLEGDAQLTGVHDDYGHPIDYRSKLSLEVIRIARDQGCPGLQDEDWSILRDAEPDHHRINLQTALNWLRAG